MQKVYSYVFYFLKSKIWGVHMNIFYIVGLVLGFGGVIFGYIEDEGVLSALVKISALSIVFGGTFGIMFMANPLSHIKKIPGALKAVFFHKKRNYNEMVDILVNAANMARRDGLLVLESHAKTVKDPFIEKGLTFISDNSDEQYLREVLGSEIEAKNRRYEIPASVFEGMGGSAPTMGVLGTVMGMVSILRDMSDMDALGGKIATAFIATLYGVGSANLLWLPLATHLKAIAEEETEYFEAIIEGLIAVQSGEHPNKIKERLLARVSDEPKGKNAKQKPEEA